jgi:hypothetical protein
MALRSRSLVLAALLIIVAPSVSFGLHAPEGLDALDERDQEVLEAIASRPPERREAALVATQYPDTLVRIELIQARSSAAFDLRMKSLDREHQEELWELVRTPGLLSELTTGGTKSNKALDEIAARYPETVRDAIGHLGGEHFALLEDAEAIKASADIEFGEEIARLPATERQAFEQLLEEPELLAMLGRSPSAVVAIGESFEADPEATRARFDELAVEVAAANAAVEEEWRESLADDPEAREELEQAAREYADEYGYDYDELTDERVHVTVRHYYDPYPYWFGYPSWYAYWYPWGWWYPVYPHFGFYYGYNNHHVYFGLPSLHFVHWFYGGHYYRYGHVARHFDHGHHGHHRSSHAVYRTKRHHERHAGWRSHRGGRPDGISSRSFRKRDGRRVFSGTRRGEFRRRTERLPDSSFGRRGDRQRSAGERDPASRGEFWRAGRVRDGARARSTTEGGRVEGQPQVDAPRRDRSGVERSGQRGAGERPRVARPDVARPEVARPEISRPRVARREGQRPPARVDRAPAQVERRAPGVRRNTRRVDRGGAQQPTPLAAPDRETTPRPSGTLQRSSRRESISSGSPPVSSGPRASSGRSRSGPRFSGGGSRGGGRAVQRGGSRGSGRGFSGGRGGSRGGRR